MARPLIIDDAAKAKVAKVVAYAMDHPYRPGDPTPGDNPNFVVMLDTYRCVFTFTRMADEKVYRHLSISVPSAKYPHPIAAFTIADLFGFTGYDLQAAPMRPGDGWIMQVNENEHCIALAQETS